MATIETDNLISISDASKLGLSALVRDAEEGNDRILVRNNKAVAVMMSMERFEEFQKARDDLIDITLAAARLLTAGTKRYSLDEVLEQFGYTREELAAMPD
jgi:PHD/YefM family antitoxin component YafN of YafNO toxin-antitoxin module